MVIYEIVQSMFVITTYFPLFKIIPFHFMDKFLFSVIFSLIVLELFWFHIIMQMKLSILL